MGNTDVAEKWEITLWVAGVRKFTFKTPIVTTTEKVTNIIVNSRYFPEIGKTYFSNTYSGGNGNRGEIGFAYFSKTLAMTAK